MSEKRPKAIACGKLFQDLGLDVDCYVLEDRRRVITQRGFVRALRGNGGKTGGAEDGKLGRLLSRLPKRFVHLAAGPVIEFELPGGGLALGREGHFLVDLCDAYADAFMAGELHHAQEGVAKSAISLLRALARTAIDVLIDEATGYQRTRAEHELDRRFAKYLRVDVAQWEMRFPPSLVQALAPLYGLKFIGGPYPRALWNPFGLIYDIVLGDDLAGEMRRRNPDHDQHCHHQVLKKPGHDVLETELGVVEVLAKQSRTKGEFWGRMRANYLGEAFQTGFA